MHRAIAAVLVLLTTSPSLALAAEPGDTNLLSLHGGLMFWTLVIFVILLFVLSKFAFKPITAAVIAREQALQKAIDDAKRDREEAARVLAEHRAALDAARGDAQRLIVEGREAGERVRAEIVEQARAEHQEMMERVRREIASEKDRAIAELRREAVDLAIKGAGKVIERNFDDAANRKLVEDFLSSVATRPGAMR
ncbi:MAG TPA: F0F1 ATP synthase subunit B [Gemmatimonadaceae bacterium]|nr:F0F1 ATP synthase subunit B [Gemmatimonadaceae bacterium]